MLATDRFLLISIGRSGTGALHKWLQEIPGLRIISNLPHERYDVMAAKCIAAGLSVPPAWTVIRNPWDYYVDKWCWETTRGPCWEGSFKGFLDMTRQQPTVEGYFYSLTQKWDDLGADKATCVARIETYNNDVVRILLSLVPDLLTEELIRQKIAQNLDIGISLTPAGAQQWLEGSYQQYYDDETRQWVRELDGELIERFGYGFLEDPR